MVANAFDSPIVHRYVLIVGLGVCYVGCAIVGQPLLFSPITVEIAGAAEEKHQPNIMPHS